MVEKIKLSHLRNAEHLQFLIDFLSILLKYNPDQLELRDLYDRLLALQQEEEQAIAVESGNAISEIIARLEHDRDRLHGSLYCYVKSFLYDEEEAAEFEAAQRIMRIIQQVGNPVQLAAAAETAMLISLGEQLKPYAADLDLIGATRRLNKLMNVNSRYVETVARRREENAVRPSGNVREVRQKADPAYRMITDVLDLSSQRDRTKDTYKPIIDEINVLIAEYTRMLNNRKSRRKNPEK
jgi:hypothetical protein